MSTELRQKVGQAIDSSPVVDLHTHLFAPQMGDLNLWGIDELLTYHYLVAESLRLDRALEPETFFAWPKATQAEFVWQKLFKERLPMSEATCGVITVLQELGFDPNNLKLDQIRQDLAKRDPIQHLNNVLQIAKVECVTMTNDPFDEKEREWWHSGQPRDPRFHTVLRIDPLFNNFKQIEHLLPAGADRVESARTFLEIWIKALKPRYCAISVPPDFNFTQEDRVGALFNGAVMRACQDHGLPFALMIGVRRAVNPRLGQAGDALGVADLTALESLLIRHPKQQFLVTTLARENAQNLIVLARKFANLTVFGCWWFMNNPSLIEEVTDMRLEMLGTDFIPQHSDARILEQVIYKWKHSRITIADCLYKRFKALELAGMTITDDHIKTEANRLLRTNALTVLGIPS